MGSVILNCNFCTHKYVCKNLQVNAEVAVQIQDVPEGVEVIISCEYFKEE